MPASFIAILMGSDSDLATMHATLEVLKRFGLSYEVRLISAYHAPARLADYVNDAEARGCNLFICGAGLAAHLAAAVAAQTIRPVIGVPIDSGPLKGQDALLATVQMAVGVPVATVAIGKTGAQNAGYLAAQIVAIGNPALAAQLREERAAISDKITLRSEELQQELGLSPAGGYSP
jgi:5-(carboxyamino)imidazole ribonucleotide mutase